MSYHFWTVYGYGFDAGEINTTPERLLKLLDCAPKFHKDVMEQNSSTDPDMNDLLLFEDEFGNTGLAPLVAGVIEEAENLYVSVCDGYVILEPSYPWQLTTEEERKLTSREQMDAVFRKYIAILTDQNIFIGYESIEQGG